MTGSLAYRKNEAAILRGDVPEKYTRIVPHVPGKRVIELGSAEGVLALLLAKAGKEVIGIEKNDERHAAAIALRKEWVRLKILRRNARAALMNASAIDGLKEVAACDYDTLVAVRMVYYLRDTIDEAFSIIAQHIPTVVLCGNRNRADRYHAGRPDEGLGEFNYYAGAEGMRALLERHGYTIVDEVLEGDPIIVGRKDG